MMSHVAREDSWKFVHDMARHDPGNRGNPRNVLADCLLELRHRLDELERQAARESQGNASNLLTKVAAELPRLVDRDDQWVLDIESARDVLRIVANELQKMSSGHLGSGTYWADWIRSQAR